MISDPLFEPLTIGTMHLANRIVMAPMTRSRAPDGLLEADVVAYYARRAAGGTGLIITEGTVVEHDVAHYSTLVPHFYGAAALSRWREVADAVHAAGGRITPQLWHTGLSRLRGRTHNPDTPSVSASAITEEVVAAPPIPGKTRQPARAMHRRDIDDVVAAFAKGAVDANALGFDGVANHGAHGYLLDQFIWARSDQRDDAYGSSLENRIRFAVDLVAAVRAAVGPDFPIFFRFSQWKSYDYRAEIATTPDELARILQPLAAAGVNVFDASTRRFWPAFSRSDLNLAGWARKLTGRVAMTVGSVGLEDPPTLRRTRLPARSPPPISRCCGGCWKQVRSISPGSAALRPYDPQAAAAALEPA